MKNAKIANVQFILSILIVMIHADCSFVRMPGLDLQYVFGLNYAAFIQEFFCEGVCRIAVPLFFMISAYLFYRSFDGTLKQYGAKLKKRLFSLGIPYVFWSFLTYLAFYTAKRIPAVGSYFVSTEIGDFSLETIFRQVIFGSLNSPLWFCRYLIVLTVLSIGLYYLYRRVPILTVLFLFYGWFFNFQGLPFTSPFRMDGIFFYSLGAVIALHVNPDKVVRPSTKKPFPEVLAGVWLVMQLIYTYLYIQQEPQAVLDGSYTPLVSYLGKLTILVGIPALWLLYDRLAAAPERIWKLDVYSFLLYVCHYPIASALGKITIRVIGFSYFNSLLAFIVSAGLTVAVIIVVGSIVKKKIPWLWRIATGNRG